MKIRGSQILGQPAISASEHRVLGSIHRLHFEPGDRTKVSLEILQDNGTRHLLKDCWPIVCHGEGVTVEVSPTWPQSSQDAPADLPESQPLVTPDGQYLGQICDVVVETNTGEICRYEIEPSQGANFKTRRVSLTPSAVEWRPEGAIARTQAETVRQQLHDARHNLPQTFGYNTAKSAEPSELLGCRVNRLITKPDGTLLAVPGQTITPLLLATARRWQMLDELSRSRTRTDPDNRGQSQQQVNAEEARQGARQVWRNLTDTQGDRPTSFLSTSPSLRDRSPMKSKNSR